MRLEAERVGMCCEREGIESMLAKKIRSGDILKILLQIEKSGLGILRQKGERKVEDRMMLAFLT